tara:strand:+ start:546 stop:782 length:237 start_codon:yes stop_codon:yes gene_type:complete
MSAIDHINKIIENLKDSIKKLEDLKKDISKEENSSAEYTSGETSSEYTSAETSAEYNRGGSLHKTSWVSSSEYYSSEF